LFFIFKLIIVSSFWLLLNSFISTLTLSKTFILSLFKQLLNINIFVSLLIFDEEYTYSNLLVKVYDKKKLSEAKIYFNELKELIINNSINYLSKIILEKMSN